MTANDTFTLLTNQLKQELTDFGFKKTGNSFARTYEESIQVIGIQKSTSSTTDFFKFRLNVGLWSPLVAKHIRRLSSSPKTIAACHSSESVSDPLKPRTDLWWTIDTPKGVEHTVADIMRVLSTSTIPKLDLLKTSQSLKHYWQTSYPDWSEIICAELEGRFPIL